MQIREWLEKVIYNEMTSGILMIAAMVASILCANSNFGTAVADFWHTQLFVGVHDISFSRSLEWWVNDVLMVFFFLQIGLELKREMREGFLSDIKQIAVPAIAATGGIICPAIIYLIFNAHSPDYINGWAIPTATDIAFAVCILMLVGGAIPKAAKIFLLAIAIFDDLGAILIIALFYNRGVSLDLLGYAGLSCMALYLLNRMQITNFALYMIFGAVLWYCFLNGGIHTTMAGVVVAMAYPMRVNIKKYSPLERLSHKLRPWVDLIILPVFAFASAGLYLGNVTVETFAHTLTLGIIFGLFLGKQLGIFTTTWIMIKLKLAKFPDEVSRLDLYGVASVAGIGFTMALFVGKLSLPEAMQGEVRLGILCGSCLSALWGALVFRLQNHLFKKRHTDALPTPEIG
ncbi:MAG: Na+/H+ antiporter NhaA [Alphaproteobacteria bacterium]|nr:Na+/H+ antiporter NhaA [Alphaproteobacteria bacterium]